MRCENKTYKRILQKDTAMTSLYVLEIDAANNAHHMKNIGYYYVSSMC